MPSSASSAQARAARMHVVVFMYLFGYLQESTVFPFWIFSFLTGALGRGLTRSDLRSAVKRRYLASLHVRNIKKAGGQVSILDHFGTHAMRAIRPKISSVAKTRARSNADREREGSPPQPRPLYPVR